MNEYILKVMNKYWMESYFPERWREAIVITFSKPQKDHSNAENYRPIALTSCICKVMEQMINNQLLDYLDMHRLILTVQCGCRRKRSTIDHLLRLETVVHRAFAHGEHVVSVFFDLQKAYDMVWKHGIMKDMHDLGLRGRLLSRRTIPEP